MSRAGLTVLSQKEHTMGGGIFMVEPGGLGETQHTVPEPPVPVTETGGAGGRGGVEGGPRRDLFIHITNPSLEQYKQQARSFIDNPVQEGRFSSKQYQALNSRIRELTPPAGSTQTQREQFDLERQLLLSEMASELLSLIPSGRETPEIAIKIEEFVTAIEREDYDKIDELVDRENFDDQLYGILMQSVLERLRGNKDKSHMVDYLLEYGVEAILRKADVSPKDPYPQPSFYAGINLESIIGMARIYDSSIGRQERRGMFLYLAGLRQRRLIMHELFRSMKERRDYVTYVTQHLRKEGLAFVEKEIVGVSDVQIIYDKVLGSGLSFAQGWLTDRDMQRLDEEVFHEKESPDDTGGILGDYNSKGKIKKNILDAKGNPIIEAGREKTRPLRPWELRRAALVGRSLNAATQRRIIYTVLGDVPVEDIDKLLNSVESEFIARVLAPIKLIAERFLGIDTTLRKIFIEELLKRTKERASANGQSFGYKKTDKDGKRTTQGLYNRKEDSWAILDTGITDIKSNSWRGRSIVLKQEDYQMEMLGGKRLDISDYLDGVRREVQRPYKERLERQFPNKNQREIGIILDRQYGEAIKTEFNNRIKETLGKQRLFLGVLLKNKSDDLNDESRGIIWKNAAKLLPSRIAAFFPEETLDIIQRVRRCSREQALEIWNGRPAKDRQPRLSGLKEKLFLAEIMRVKDDAKNLKGKTWPEIEQEGLLKNLSDYYQDAGIGEPSMGLGEQDPEIRIIEELRDLVTKDHGKLALELARIKFPYTPFLDDVPKTDWENLEDTAYDRILVYDQTDFEEGYREIIGLIANPVERPEKIVEAFIKAENKINSPLGRKGKNGSQAYIEKYISTYLSMARMNGWSKLISPLMKVRRIPRSKMEEGNLQSQIAYNPDTSSNILSALAQRETISDDPSETDERGRTQHMRMKEENDADMKAKMQMWAWMMLLIFGSTLGMEFIKAYLPQDVARSFQ